MIKQLLSTLKISTFSRHVAIVMAGTILSQALPVLASPVLTRMFTTVQFGVFTLYYSASAIFTLLATLRYEMAIILPEKKQDAINVLILSVIITIATTIISIPLILLLREPLAGWFNEPNVIKYFLLIPVSVLSTGLYMSGYYWLLRNRQFKKVAVARFFQNFIWAASSVLLGYLGFQNGGLIYGLLLGQVISTLLVLAWTYMLLRKEKITFAVAGLKELAVRYKKFPGINALHALVDTLQLNGITYLLSLFFGNGVLGLYAIAFRTLRAPLAMVGSAMSQVLFQRFSEANNTHQPIEPLVRNAIRALFLLGIIPFTILLFAGPWLFKVVFGAEWEMAGRYAQLLTPWLFFNFLLSPISQLPNVLQRQGKYFRLTLFSNVLAFALVIILSICHFPVQYVLFAYSVCLSVFAIILIRWKYNLSEKYDKHLLPAT